MTDDKQKTDKDPFKQALQEADELEKSKRSRMNVEAMHTIEEIAIKYKVSPLTEIGRAHV